MQPLLVEFQREHTLLYKSLGGCDVCTRQRFTEFSYLLVLFLANPLSGWWNLLHIVIFFFYGGLAFYFEALITIQKQEEKPIVKSQKIDL